VQIVLPAEVEIASAMSGSPPAQVALEAVRSAVPRPDRIGVPRKPAATEVHPAWEVAVAVVVVAVVAVEGGGNQQWPRENR
jgi:hypothetical protein